MLMDLSPLISSNYWKIGPLWIMDDMYLSTTSYKTSKDNTGEAVI